MKWTRRTTATVLAAVIAVGGLSGTAAAAHGDGEAAAQVTTAVAPAEVGALAALCWRFDCTGKDPQSKNCSTGGRDLLALWPPRESLQLRFGPKCDAVWARVTMAQDTPNEPFHYKRRAKVERQEFVAKSWKTTETYEVVATQNTTKWTKMVPNYNYGARMRACWRMELFGGGKTAYECTGWYTSVPE
jgi:hypothetical protein